MIHLGTSAANSPGAELSQDMKESLNLAFLQLGIWRRRQSTALPRRRDMRFTSDSGAVNINVVPSALEDLKGLLQARHRSASDRYG